MQIRLFKVWNFIKIRVNKVQQGSKVRWRVSVRSSHVEHTDGSYIMEEYYTPSCFSLFLGHLLGLFLRQPFFCFLLPCVLWPGFVPRNLIAHFSFFFLSESLSFIETQVIKRNPGKNAVRNRGLQMGKTLKYTKLSAWIMLASGLPLSPTCQFPSNGMWIIAKQDNWWAPSGFW